MKLTSFVLAFVLTAASVTIALASGPIHTDFEKGLPPGWKPAEMGPQRDRGVANTVEESGGNHFLRISTDGSFYSIGITSPFNPRKYPMLSWRWRVVRPPTNADIADRRRDDAAARLFVTFANPKSGRTGRTRALVYVWDSKQPVGTILPSPFYPQTEKLIVLESAGSPVGKWVSERVDLASDYRRAFGAEPPNVEKIACASGSAHTHSASVADFDDLQVTARTDADRK